MVKENLRLILASQSEIRKRALRILGLPFECIPAYIDEKAIRDPDHITMAIMLSEAKAREIAKREEGVIIAGDAFLLFEGKILEKPESLEDAHAMLRSLSGKQYTFVSGLAVFDTRTQKMRSKAATSEIYLRHIFDDEIIDYCSRYPVLKIAGAHEGDGISLFSKKVEGSYINETAICVSDLRLMLNEIIKEQTDDCCSHNATLCAART